SLSQVLPSLAVVSVWVRIGFDTMIFLAALQSIPEEYYEAANMDGASGMQRLRYITLPLLNAQIVMVCILELIFNFKIFDQVYVTTQGRRARARPSSACCTTRRSSSSGSETPRSWLSSSSSL